MSMSRRFRFTLLWMAVVLATWPFFVGFATFFAALTVQLWISDEMKREAVLGQLVVGFIALCLPVLLLTLHRGIRGRLPGTAA